MKTWLFCLAAFLFCSQINAKGPDFIFYASYGNLSDSTLTFENSDSFALIVDPLAKGPKFVKIAELIDRWEEEFHFSIPSAALSFVDQENVYNVVLALQKPTFENGVLTFPATQFGKPQTGVFSKGTLYVENSYKDAE